MQSREATLGGAVQVRQELVRNGFIFPCVTSFSFLVRSAPFVQRRWKLGLRSAAAMSSLEWPYISPPPFPPPQATLPPLPPGSNLPQTKPPQSVRGLPADSGSCATYLTPSSIDSEPEDIELQQVRVIADLYPVNIWSTETNSKRSLPEDDEVELARPQKAIRSTQGFRADSPEDSELQTVPLGNHNAGVQLHAEDGFFGRRYWCTCLASYTRKSSLTRHIEEKAKAAVYQCPDCREMFTRKEGLARHCENQHQEGKVKCPGCHQRFRGDHLLVHLRSPQREQCRMIHEALYMDANHLHLDLQLVADPFWTSDVADVFPLRLDGRTVLQEDDIDDDPLPSEQHFRAFGEDAKRIANTMQHYRGMRVRPILRFKDEPCSLCGLPLGSNTQELADHIMQHLSAVLLPNNRCEDCKIDFRFAADLELHLAAAKKGRCGFNFLHCTDPCQFANDEGCCQSAHHPPSNPKTSHDDHQRVQTVLYIWENRQIRAHRVAIARLQAKLLLHEKCFEQPYRHSLGNDGLMCLAQLYRSSVVSVESFRSVPAWLKFFDDLQDDRSDSKEDTLVPRLRPESMVLPSTCAAVSQSLLAYDNAIAHRSNSPTNTYISQVQALRTPGGLKSKASGVLYRTKAMTRQILGDNSVTQVPCGA